MECNRDEAVRAMDIASKKFSDKDFMGAKKFALKAQNLYPSLEGISQMILNLDVHISAQRKLNGEMDWYTILGVQPTADSATIKKQYRKSALSYHPDKNKSVGAESTFQIIQEGFSVLTDDVRRSAYDQKMNINRLAPLNVQRVNIPVRPSDYQPASNVPGNPFGNCTGPSSRMPPYWNWNQQPGGPGANQRPPSQSADYVPVPPHGSTDSQRRPQQNVNAAMRHDSSKSTASTPKVQSHRKSQAQGPVVQQGSSVSKQVDDGMDRVASFWTKCSNCKTIWEYKRFFINRNLLCRFCDSAFAGLEVTRPINLQKKVTAYSRNQNQPASVTDNTNRNNMAASSSHAASQAAADMDQFVKRREDPSADGKGDKKWKQSDDVCVGRNSVFDVTWKSKRVRTRRLFRVAVSSSRYNLTSLCARTGVKREVNSHANA